MMKKNHIVIKADIFPLIFILLIPALVFSCGRKESPDKRVASKALNTYSSESVFDEVKKKLEKNPEDVDALYHLADLYDRNSQYAEAINTYKKVVKLKPEMGYAYLKMATAYDRINQPAEAIPMFKKAIKYMPDNPVAYNNLGVAYGKLNKFNEEIDALKRAVRLRPSYASARYNLGITYLKVGNKKGAMREYESLKQFDEGTAEALMKEIKGAS